MSEATRRFGLYVLVGFAVMLVYTLLYQYGMATFENHEVSFLRSLHVVVETFTTTGYGEMASAWDTPQMLLFSILMQLTGVTLIFMTLPLFVVPLVEEALSRTPPSSVDLIDHVIICTFTPRGATLVEELEAMERPYVVVEPDRDRAEELWTDGYTVIHGDPETVDDLENAAASEALALVADADDETNASIILSAKRAAPDLHVVSLIEDDEVADYHRYAGADKVVSPRRLLGESLAKKATTSVDASLGGNVEIGDGFDIAELLVQRGSRIAGRTIAESGIADLTGTNIIGAWFRGEFVSPPAPDDVVDEHTILLVAGPTEQLDRLRERTLSPTRRHRTGNVAIAGYGVVGATVAETLASANVTYRVVDLAEKPGVDIVGDITERRTVERADLDATQSVIITLNDDTTTIFATLVIKQMAPEVEVIARANETESVPKLYRAGAEYVLALSTVSGRLLASNLLDEDVITPDIQVELVRRTAPALVGRTLADADVRARTSCTVIAVERDGDLLTEVGPDFRVRHGDELIVAGSDAAINRFNELASGS